MHQHTPAPSVGVALDPDIRRLDEPRIVDFPLLVTSQTLTLLKEKWKFIVNLRGPVDINDKTRTLSHTVSSQTGWERTWPDPLVVSGFGSHLKWLNTPCKCRLDPS